MGAKKASFRIKKSLLSGFLAFLPLVLSLAAVGIYLYIGLQPIEVDASAPVRLEVPAIGLATPVEELERLGNTLVAPEVTVGAYQEQPGKTLLIGHYNTIFKRLGELTVGDEIAFDGVAYRVQSRQILAKTEVDMAALVAESGQETLILMTCAGERISGDDYTHRLIIEAERE